MNYRSEIAYQRIGPFHQKVPTFSDYVEAELYAESLAERSSMIADYRVLAVDASPTHTFVGGKLQAIAVWVD